MEPDNHNNYLQEFPPPGMTEPQLVLIGLDGVRLDVLKRFRSDLPTIRKFLDDGVYGNLESILPGPHSGPAWASFSTGVNPGRHGIGDWRIKDGYEFPPATRDDVPCRRFWQYLSQEGYSVGIFNIPLTSPPEPLNGVLVSSWADSSEGWAYPRSFQRELENLGYERKPEFTSPDDPIENLLESIEAKRKGFERYLDSYDWNFLLGMFYETEQAHHQFASLLDPEHPEFDPTYEEKLLRVYEKIDDALQTLKDRVGDVPFFVISDHGFCPIYERIHLNYLLQKHGYYARRKNGDSERNVSDRLLLDLFRRLKSSTAVREFGKQLAVAPIVGRAVAPFIDRYRSVEYVKRVRADWNNTMAFTGHEHGGIFLNTVSDHPQGIVSDDDTEEIAGRIVADLGSDEFLAPRINGIYRREELFDGGRIGSLPHVIVDFADGYLGSSGHDIDRPARGASELREEGKYIGFHTMEGVFLGDGPGVATGEIEDLSLLDIAPTVLKYFGVPVPEAMDGTPMDAVLARDSEFVNRSFDTTSEPHCDPPSSENARTITQAEREEIESRLQEMGYR